MGNVLDRAGSGSRLSLGESIRVWERVLRQSRISDDDDVFGLGGEPLPALELFHEIERRTGEQIPATAMDEAPSRNVSAC